MGLGSAGCESEHTALIASVRRTKRHITQTYPHTLLDSIGAVGRKGMPLFTSMIVFGSWAMTASRWQRGCRMP